MKKVVAIIALALLMVGCGTGTGEEEKNVVCTLNYGSSQVEEEVKIEKDSDGKATKIIVTKEAALADYLFEQHSKEELEKLYESDYVNPNREQKGLKFDISVDENDKKLTVVIEINPNTVSELDMNDLGLKEYMDTTKLVKALEAESYTCKTVD